MGHIIGFPRIGENRELKKSLELFWSSKSSEKDLEKTAAELRAKHWNYQKNLDNVCVNDFSFYDNMLDLAFAIGAVPKRFSHLNGLECYFAMARGNKDSVACQMTKWFNTNYHYVVPELSIDDKYKLNIDYIIKQYNEAKNLGYKPKISLIGIFTFIELSKITDGSFDEIFNNVKNIYFELLDELSKLDKEIIIEFNEPIFVKGENNLFFKYIKEVYNEISQKNLKAIVTTYFEHSNEASNILLKTGIFALGLDFVYGSKNLEIIEKISKSGKTLYAGIIDGRNIWISNLQNKLEMLNKISQYIPKNKIVISSSCSLLHVPYSKNNELKMDKDILSWLSFSMDKIKEIEVLENIFFDKVSEEEKKYFEENININNNRLNSKKINDDDVFNRMKSDYKISRDLDFKERIKVQRKLLKYPNLATTTIGSYPQTSEIRAVRMYYKKGQIGAEEYESKIKEYIKNTIEFQESVGLDVLVHGEPERNDMVEYFGEQLNGFVFSENAWVQSYGSRCVKPPIIYGDISRPKAMTVKWIAYAQSLTNKIVKGMLTGPVTILNWSFVRNDIDRSEVCKQIAFAISDEINDLQNSSIKIIQVDEAAFKEGYPLRKENISSYEKWAVESFKIATSIARTETQIHTHMCYSDFNDIIKTIEKLDADVISIETSRSGNELLKVFEKIGYTHEIGPGVYDIHSPRIPSVEEFINQINALLEVLPKEQLWINPDCGLKTRKWEEVKPSLKNMVEAVKKINK
ncbi:5-methyltetrahydropteroyltriglutamate--homocysteine S-methyltransferase [uncultured Brachyspira sp.]|uniref:5-methyltetrahydropteroyltriglutamate-- homocysteine S-methyltransferase n=1 Tax=uncultured Brachyspira sp. TaxID=221953 RepID=UPI0025EF8D06|nr:5-methyltetrahydropteroyltriglutamate--homocysteine S-methyltransferase [uncultured Brachyspira sp.]